MCVIKAAASGIHYCGYEDPAAAIMESAINTRRKTKDVVTLLRAQGVTTEDVTTRSNDAPSLLEKVTKLVEKKDPSRVLTELVDANGQSGHAVFIDCANQVIIDPANPRVVPFIIHELDRCTGPYTMCVGLKHPKFVHFAASDSAGTKTKKRKRAKRKTAADHNKQARTMQQSKPGATALSPALTVVDLFAGCGAPAVGSEPPARS